MARAARASASSCPTSASVTRGCGCPAMRSLSNVSSSRARLAMTSNSETKGYGLPDLCCDVVGRGSRIDQHATLRFARRKRMEKIAKPLMEIHVEMFEARLAGAPCAGAGKSCFHRYIQDESEIRPERPGGNVFNHGNGFRIKPAARALIGIGGIGEAVADHPVSGEQGGPDRYGQMIHACREHQERFGKYIPAPGFAFNQERPDLLGAGRTTRLARRADRDAAHLKRGSEALRLRGFAGALPAFESDKARLLRHQAGGPKTSVRRPRNMRPNMPTR